MLGIPDWAIGLAFATVALFTGIGILLRVMPAELRGGARKRPPAQRGEALEELERKLSEVGDIHTRFGELEDVQRRLAELEERLDFAERLLIKQRDAERIAPPPR